MSDITQVLDAITRGEKQASEDLLPLVYEELRRLAQVRMANEAAGQTSNQPPWCMRLAETGRERRSGQPGLAEPLPFL